MANKYWNGTGTWATATYWFSDDAHTTPTTVPSSLGTDDVYFTSNSTGVCTISASAYCQNLDMTGFAGTLAGTSTLNVYGGLKLSGGTFSFSGNIDTYALTGSYEIWTNGNTVGQLTIKGNDSNIGASYIFMDNYTAGTGKWLEFRTGSLNFNGKTFTLPTGFRTLTTSTRTLIMGNSTFNLGSSSSAWSVTSTNMTFSGGTETINLIGNFAGFTGGNLSYNKVYFNGANTNITLNSNDTFNELKIIPTTTTSQIYTTLSGNLIVNNTLVLSGSSSNSQVWLKTVTIGIPKTITNNGSLTMSNVDFQDIIGSGSTTWSSGTRVGDCGGNSGIMFDSPRTLYWVAYSGGTWSSQNSWSLTSGGSSGEYQPLPQDDVVFTSNSITSISKTITINCNVLGKNVSFENLINNPTLNGSLGYSPRLYGNLTLGTSQTHSNAQFIYWYANSASTMLSNGKSFQWNIYLYFRNCTLTLTDDCNISQLRIICGVFNTNNKNITCNSIGSNSEINTVGLLYGASTNLGSSLVTIYGAASSILDFNYTPFILSAGTSLIKMTASGGGTSSDVTFSGGGKTFYDVWFSAPLNVSYYWLIVGNNKYHDLKFTPSSQIAIQFKMTSSSVQTVNTFTAIGSSGKLIKIMGSTVTGTWTLSGSTTKNCCDYLNLSGSTATPTNIFYAGTNSLNTWSNTGWSFSSCSSIKAVTQVLYASSVSKVLGIDKSSIYKITNLS